MEQYDINCEEEAEPVERPESLNLGGFVFFTSGACRRFEIKSVHESIDS